MKYELIFNKVNTYREKCF